MYSAVGHGGASGYIAVLALFAYPAGYIRYDSLVLNIAVSAIAFFYFYKAGHLNWKLLLPLIIASVPMAFLGGNIKIDTHIYKIILGILLLIPAMVFLIGAGKKEEGETRNLPLYLSVIFGGILGFVSGITGIGGGVFLSPLLILGKWSTQKKAAAISAPFILVNSISGLMGGIANRNFEWDNSVLYFALFAIVGGLIGARLGSGKLPVNGMKIILGVVLVMASLKLLLT